VSDSVAISKEAIDKLQYLISVSEKNSNNANNISGNVNNQLSNSDTIKYKISNLVEDTKKAIEGSHTNITLGQSLLDNLKN
jgi:methyl-accepting chemotaxis protein